METVYFNKHNHPKTEGIDYHEEYVTEELEFIDDNGQPYLETVNTYNQYERTQSHKDECTIENILKAAAMGDLSLLQQREATYIDTTSLPKSLREAQDLVIRMKYEFNNMPSEVKELFNNSPEMYINTMGTDEFNEKMAPYNQKIAQIKEAGSLKAYEKKVKEAAKFNKDVKAAEGSEET